jgi:hypothetical protein
MAVKPRVITNTDSRLELNISAADRIFSSIMGVLTVWMIFTIPLFFRSRKVTIDFDDTSAELTMTKYGWSFFGSDLRPKIYRVPYSDVLRMHADSKHQVYQTSEHGYSETTWHYLSIPDGRGSSVQVIETEDFETQHFVFTVVASHVHRGLSSNEATIPAKEISPEPSQTPPIVGHSASPSIATSSPEQDEGQAQGKSRSQLFKIVAAAAGILLVVVVAIVFRSAGAQGVTTDESFSWVYQGTNYYVELQATGENGVADVRYRDIESGVIEIVRQDLRLIRVVGPYGLDSWGYSGSNSRDPVTSDSVGDGYRPDVFVMRDSRGLAATELAAAAEGSTFEAVCVPGEITRINAVERIAGVECVRVQSSS